MSKHYTAVKLIPDEDNPKPADITPNALLHRLLRQIINDYEKIDNIELKTGAIINAVNKEKTDINLIMTRAEKYIINCCLSTRNLIVNFRKLYVLVDLLNGRFCYDTSFDASVQILDYSEILLETYHFYLGALDQKIKNTIAIIFENKAYGDEVKFKDLKKLFDGHDLIIPTLNKARNIISNYKKLRDILTHLDSYTDRAYDDIKIRIFAKYIINDSNISDHETYDALERQARGAENDLSMYLKNKSQDLRELNTNISTVLYELFNELYIAYEFMCCEILFYR